MDIIFNPPVNKENQYIRLLVGQLRSKGYRVHPLDTFFSGRKHFNSIRLVHLNWFENIDDSGFFVALRSFLRKLVVLTILRVSGKPLVWTMHNRVSHENRLSFFSRTITRLLMHWSHRIVIHTHQSEDVLVSYGPGVLKKAVFIPHPHFIGVYGAVPTSDPDPGTLSLLFTGMVKPYKNLELLIDVVAGFRERVALTIAGKAVDDTYRQQLVSQASQAGNVTILPYFVPDGEVAALLARADVVVLPYALTSSLNSGTVMLAFSYKKTVICPEIGTITDLSSSMENTFHYCYKTGEQHRGELTKQIMKALELKERNPTALSSMGEQLYADVLASNDPKRIGSDLDNLYRELMERAS